MVSIEFNQFQQLVINLFPSIEVLRISGDAKYMNANRWKQLILSYLPNLRIFDILLDVYTGTDDDQLRFEDQINQFISSTHRELIENLYRNGLITTERIKNAMLKVDRGDFTDQKADTYSDRPQSSNYKKFLID
jgi:hypothetical protein